MRRDDVAAALLVGLEQRDGRAEASLLSPGVRMVVDTGDATGGEVRGRPRVVRALRDLQARHPDAAFATAHVNGAPGVVLRRRTGEVVAVLAIDAGFGWAGRIRRLWLTAAPGKLAHWNRGRPTG